MRDKESEQEEQEYLNEQFEIHETDEEYSDSNHGSHNNILNS